MSIKHSLSMVMALLLLGITPRQLSAQEKAKEQRCAVHREVLKRDKVPIIYGLTLPDQEYLGARLRNFQNANTSVYGGCVIEVDSNNQQISPSHTDVQYCQKCREDEALWRREYKAKGPRHLIDLLPKLRKPRNKGTARIRG